MSPAVLPPITSSMINSAEADSTRIPTLPSSAISMPIPSTATDNLTLSESLSITPGSLNTRSQKVPVLPKHPACLVVQTSNTRVTPPTIPATSMTRTPETYESISFSPRQTSKSSPKVSSGLLPLNPKKITNWQKPPITDWSGWMYPGNCS